MTADTLLERLRRHYIKPARQGYEGGIFVPEVGWNGAADGRRCDAIYVGFTSTSGRLLVGHELKASRADWLRELAQPGKADPWADQCHAWYLVVSELAIIAEGELPDGWGLMVPFGNRMRTITKPQVHRDRTPSWAATRSVISRYDTLRIERMRRETEAIRDELRRDNEKRRQEQLDRSPQHAPETRARDVLAAISDALGMTVESWAYGPDRISAEELGGALKAYIAADRDVRRALQQLGMAKTDQIRQAVDALDRALATPLLVAP